MRLRGSSHDSDEGRVEIFYEREWGTICDDFWDLRDAQVACRELGYVFAVSALHGWRVRNHGDSRIWLDNLHCTGNERSLADCPHNGWGNHNCRSYGNAGVECSPTGKDISTILLSSPH